MNAAVRCRYEKKIQHYFRSEALVPCRNVKIGGIIAERNDLTTRLADKKMPGLSLRDLENGRVIKGLMIYPKLESNGCYAPEPLIVFGKPVVAGNNLGLQHRDIARKLKLDHDKDISYLFELKEFETSPAVHLFWQRLVADGYKGLQGEGSDYLEKINNALKNDGFREKYFLEDSPGLSEQEIIRRNREILEKKYMRENLCPKVQGKNGFWGFMLSPISFFATDISQTLVNFSISGSLSCRISVNTAREPGLVTPSNGEVDLYHIRNIGEETAAKFWEQNVYAFLFRTNREKDNEVYAVRAASGHYGFMPRTIIPAFLRCLSRYVAPDFAVFNFISDGGLFMRGRIIPSWADVKRPGCLEWDSKYRLIQDGELPPKGFYPEE